MPTAHRRQHDASTRRAIHNTATRRALHNKSSSSGCNCGCGHCFCSLCTTAGSTTKCWFNVDASDIDYTVCDNQCIGGLTMVYTESGEGFGSFTCANLPTRLNTTTSVIDPNGSFDHAGNILFNSNFSSLACLDPADQQQCQWGVPGNSQTISGITYGSLYGPDGKIFIDGPFASPGGSCSVPFDESKTLHSQPYWRWVLAKTAENWYLAYCALFQFPFTDNDSSFFSNFYVILYKFQGTLSATDADDCGATLTFTNDLPGCGPFDGAFDSGCDCVGHIGVSLASGGTAVVTWTDTPP